MSDSITLTEEELTALTGYTQAGRVLTDLHRQGFHRARRGPVGIILERSHYEAVAAGKVAEGAAPKVRPPKLKFA